jgi:phosphoserine aminotransferase
MTKRIFNFSAGPAVLPEPVLKKAQEAIWDAAGSGIGIMEHSHRGKVFERVRDEAEQACRDLAGIPDNYRVLFLQGGASLQFSMVPMNLLPPDRTADYLLTGVWSQKAVKEAKVLGAKVHIAATGESTGFDRIPQATEINYSERPAYVHLTTNNTIYGTQWRAEPAVPAGVPLVADTSSDMYSRPIDVSKYGLIYAGAQKNLGPSGVVLVIIRDDLVEAGPKTLPTMLQYRTHSAEKSLYNTPALRLHRPDRLLPRHGSTRQPIADERLFPGPDRGAGKQVHRRGDQARTRRAEGSSQRRRHARQHLQRLSPRGGRGAGRVHEGVRAGQPGRRQGLRSA